MLVTRVMTAVALLALLLVVLYSNSLILFLAVNAAFLAGALWEGFRVFQSKHPILGASIWTLAFALVVMQPSVNALILLFSLCVTIWAVRFTPSLALGLPRLDSIGNRFLGMLYVITILGCFLAIVALFQRSATYLISVMAIVWVADIGAYFTGKAFGKRKLAPSISPGKSWEGALGGWLLVLLFAGATVEFLPAADTFAFQIQNRFGWLGFLLVMSLMVAASVVGDLFESQLKRRAGVKDSSRLLPGHGGILDRIDALIPTLPLAVLAGSWI